MRIAIYYYTVVVGNRDSINALSINGVIIKAVTLNTDNSLTVLFCNTVRLGKLLVLAAGRWGAADNFVQESKVKAHKCVGDIMFG
ncbi:MAG: hypothetical protein DSM106950_24410 [Stigonema ocellatum SAG 48.90 = DSM 106950]|nr:hypothetical protein [Stigonema ocellatum SAG 48.90 = DSM 106950]